MGFERPLHLGNSRHAADGGHVALIEVAETRPRLMGEVGSDDFGYVIAHLHGGLGDSGNLASILFEMRQVAEHKDFGESGRIESVVDDDATSLVEGGAEQFAERGSLH